MVFALISTTISECLIFRLGFRLEVFSAMIRPYFFPYSTNRPYDVDTAIIYIKIMEKIIRAGITQR